MIHVIDELKLNDFKACHCVRPKDLFARYGKRLVDASYDSSEEIVPMNLNKLDSIEYLEQYDRMMQNQSNHDDSTQNHDSQKHDSDGESA